jgi:hypothetical protein
MPDHHEKRPKVQSHISVWKSQVPTVERTAGLAKASGLVIDYVEPNSPAATAGVQPGQHPQNAERPNSDRASQLRSSAQAFPEGTEVTSLSCARHGAKLTVKLAGESTPATRCLSRGQPRLHWDFDATAIDEQMKDLKEQLKNNWAINALSAEPDASSRSGQTRA